MCLLHKHDRLTAVHSFIDSAHCTSEKNLWRRLFLHYLELSLETMVVIEEHMRRGQSEHVIIHDGIQKDPLMSLLSNRIEHIPKEEAAAADDLAHYIPRAANPIEKFFFFGRKKATVSFCCCSAALRFRFDIFKYF